MERPKDPLTAYSVGAGMKRPRPGNKGRFTDRKKRLFTDS